mgnify:FL=1
MGFYLLLPLAIVGNALIFHGVVGFLIATRTHTTSLRTKRSDRAYKTCMAGALLVVFATSVTFITWS